MSDEDIKGKCIDLLVKKRGDERYRGWATGAVDRYLARNNSLEKLLINLKQDKIVGVMTRGNFFSPRIVEL
jgi:hypothetical protein